MLSIENPPPSSSDLPCPSCEEISQLKSSSSGDGDERASDEVDLLKSGLDDNNINPLPKFSIRDYVFSARSKDIKTNWPFSQKNLKLCLSHGVIDLLPPFQPLESVRYRSSPIENEKIATFDHGEPSRRKEGERDNLAMDCVNIGSSGSEGEKDNQVPLTTNDQSRSEIDTVTADHKTQSKNEPPIKKYRLTVKVGSGGADHPSSKEDPTTNCVAVSETMASKVCPVCKTFSSSSNTTLNAHIDQCLSMESDLKWTPSSNRVVKHRVKPRKTRLMVDIYATAPYCTLEELDRRNGTNWAVNTSFPTQETVGCAHEEEKERVLPVNFKKKGDEGEVYIDENGTKVRILSKFGVTSSVPKTDADLGPRKNFKGDNRGRKLVSKYKKRHHAQKHHKYMKLALQSKQSCSSNPRRTTEVRGDDGRNVALEGNCRREESRTQSFKAQDQIKLNDSGTMMKWARSKRTSLLKRHDRKESLQHLGCNFRREFPAESDQSSLGDSYMERSCVRKPPNSYGSPISSPESSKRMEDSTFKTHFTETNEEPRVTKRVGFSSFGSKIGGKKRFLEPPNCNVKQLRVDSASIQDGSCKDFANNGECYAPFRGKEPVEINAGPVITSSRDVSSDLPQSHAFSLKAPKFSSLKKDLLSASQSSGPTSKYKVNQKCSSHKKFGIRCTVEKHDSKLKHAENQSQIGRRNVLNLRKKRGAFGISQNEESTSLKSASECHSHEAGNDLDSSNGVGRDFGDNTISGRKGIRTHEDNNVIEPSLGVDLGANAVSLSRSLAPNFHKLASPSNSLAGSLHPTHPSLDGDEQEMFCVDEVGDGMIGENTDVGEGIMESKDGQGNYFTEVDPIPIPGPPGSFLPSPRDMGSEDLQGNSSITTSRVHSSEDHHDLVDRDSSDSPISATSTISNSMIARSDAKSSEKLSVGPKVIQDAIHLGFSVASCDSVAENTERINLDELKVSMIVPHDKGLPSFRNDQPCCCSRKEGISKGVSLNFQESPLLKRRTMASVTLSSVEKQLSCDSNRRPNSSNSMPEVMNVDNFPVSVKVSADSALNSPNYGDCDSASPSASNSVLRLMGKNLMVVNKEENVSQPFKPIQSISPSDHPNPQFQTRAGFSPGNSQNEDLPCFYRMVLQNPLSSGYVTSKTPQMSSHPYAGVVFSKNVGGGFTSSLEPNEHKVRPTFHNDQYRSRNRNADSTTSHMKEIIVIDDTSPYSEGMRENGVSSAHGISIPVMAANYNSRQVNPFYSYQPQESSPYNGSQSHVMAQRASANPVNLRAPMYYSPSFS